MSGPHRLLLASAGTGKTYQLATHFAGLLAGGVDPSRVLATTFTRKAAGEILDRVLQRLVEASDAGPQGARARAELGAAMRRVDPLLVDPTRERCLARLAELVRAIGRFQVRTLDAFFVQVAGLFAYELSLAPEWRIVDDVEDDEVRAEVLSALVEALGDDERVALLRGVARAGAPTASHSELLQAIDRGLALHRETYPGEGEAAWDRLDEPDRPTEAAFDAAVRDLVSFEQPETKAGKSHKSWLSVPGRLEELADPDDWSLWWKYGLVEKILAGETSYYRLDIPDSLIAAVRVVSDRARADEIAEVLQENRATGRLLELYVAEERRARDASGAYRFDDFPRALGRGPAGKFDAARRAEVYAQWRADLGFRLDGRIQHLLLDEFQDTAPLQWRLLLPLAEEFLAHSDGSRTFFCVGDVKQSIYGWREAEPRLLGEMHLRHPVLVPEQLTESWRSSVVVLTTVNRIFADLPLRTMFAGEDRASLREAAAGWAAGFGEHTRATAAAPLPGAAVLLEAAPPERQGQHAQACVDLAARRVIALRGEAPGASIAVLMRGKKHIPRLLFMLRQAGVEASDEGGNPLVDAPVVAQALALLHLADHPADRVAALAVGHSPFARAYGLVRGAETRFDARRPDAGERAADASRRLRRELAAEGIGGLFEHLAEKVLDADGAGTSSWDRTRFAQLIELALAHDERAGLRPAAFADVVRRTKVEDPSAATVKVMTIHASKGLEFDAVVLPELHGELLDTRARVLSERADAEDPLSPIDVLTRAPRKAVAEADPQFAPLRAAQQARGIVDELSVLYVATTRAKHRLEMILPAPPGKGVDLERLRFAELLREALLDGPGGPPDDESVLWRHAESAADGAWFAPGDGDSAGAAPDRVRVVLAAAERPRTEARRAPSAAEVRRPDAASLLAAPDRRARVLGTLVHALLEDVEWIEDEARDDAALLARCRQVASDEGLAAAAVERFRAALADPKVRASLSRASVPADLEVEVQRERAFDVELSGAEEDERWGGAIDRLVLLRRDGVLERAEILDFKTDAAQDDAELQRRHAPQLEAYRRVVCALMGLAPELVTARALAV